MTLILAKPDHDASADTPMTDDASPTRSPPHALNMSTFACTTCQQRKVKCSKTKPICHSCAKSGRDCVYVPPKPPQRRRKRQTEDELRAKVHKYEEMLKDMSSSSSPPPSSYRLAATRLRGPQSMESDADAGCLMGVSLSTLPGKPAMGARNPFHNPHGNPDPNKIDGKLLMQDKGSHYVESNLWMNVASHNIEEPEDDVSSETSSDDYRYASPNNSSAFTPSDLGSFILNPTSSEGNLQQYHPTAAHGFRLWQTYIDNVDGLCKVLHTPTTQRMLLEAMSDTNSISIEQEALMFSIYAAAVNSLSDSECVEMFNESRQILMRRYSHAAKHALTRAKFMKSSDLKVLQAFCLLLVVIRDSSDDVTYWTLTGVGMRIATRLGLHRDASRYGLAPFDVEMRRRLWFGLFALDVRAAELSGTGLIYPPSMWDTESALNVNDSELFPGMANFPEEHVGVTTASFMTLRCTFGRFILSPEISRLVKGRWMNLTTQDIPMADKEKLISQCQALMWDQFGRHCDTSIPFHAHLLGVTKSVTNKMILGAYHPRQYKGDQSAMPEAHKDKCFDIAMEMLGIDIDYHTDPVKRRFLWHARGYFQLDAYVYLLGDLCSGRITGDRAINAWRCIFETYENHRELATNKSMMYSSMRALLTRALHFRIAQCHPDPPPEGTPPHLAEMLQSSKTSNATTSPAPSVPTPSGASLAADVANLEPLPITHIPTVPKAASSNLTASPPFTVAPIAPGLPPGAFEFPPTMDFSGPNAFGAPEFNASGAIPALDWAYWDDMLRFQ